MPLPSGRAIRVLTFGRDQVLLDSRCRIIALLGVESATADTEKQFYEAINRTEDRYELCIFCHSVPREKRPELHAAATARGIAVYQIEDFVEPTDFLAEIQKILSINHRDEPEVTTC